MNARFFRAFLPLACLLAGAGASAQTAAPQPKAAATIFQNPLQASHTCANPNFGGVFQQADGGYVETFEGWFDHAEVHTAATGGGALAYCYYGIDKINPSGRPAYSVHYPMNGFGGSQCRVSGATITCSRIAVIKEAPLAK
jgi:hypothetical protein